VPIDYVSKFRKAEMEECEMKGLPKRAPGETLAFLKVDQREKKKGSKRLLSGSVLLNPKKNLF
jgi:hypothetical protein